MKSAYKLLENYWPTCLDSETKNLKIYFIMWETSIRMTYFPVNYCYFLLIIMINLKDSVYRERHQGSKNVKTKG
jgi:hypothetical protein